MPIHLWQASKDMKTWLISKNKNNAMADLNQSGEDNAMDGLIASMILIHHLWM